MGSGKQKKKIIRVKATTKASLSSIESPLPVLRNLRKSDLGAVIFGCTHNTINECLSKQLFGRPGTHYSRVKNISKGLVLFLFNYSDRKLHGIFEAAGPGQMNIDRDALIGDGDSTGCKHYSAQVRIRVRKHCQPLSENQFRPIIAENYYTDEHFSFELDQDQTLNLISLFSLDSSASSPPIAKRCNYISHSLSGNPKRLESRTIQNGPKLEYKAMQNGPKLEYKAIRNAPKLEYKAVQYDFRLEYKAIQDGQRLEYKAIQDGQRLEYTALQTSQRLDHKAIENLAVNQAYEDNGDFLQGNNLKESQVNATDEVEHVQTSESSGQHLDDRSSHQTLDDYVDCNVSSSTETGESDEIEFHEKKSSSTPESVAELETLSDPQSLIHKLMQDVQELKGSQLKQIVKISILEQDLVDSKDEIQQLRNSHCHLESKARSVIDSAEVDSQLPSKLRSIFADPVFIVGGYDGSSWLSTLDSYFPSHDINCSLSPMKFKKQYASAATSNGELYHFGGLGYHTVESFSPTMNQWILRPSLFWKNIHIAGASVTDRLFVAGGEQGGQSSSEVEYLDLNIGKWFPTHSMQSKRSAPAAVELNNALYVTGGCDGVSYLSSVERLDPREGAWCNLPNMKTRKKCHSMVVLNGKIYTLGGFEGDKYVATVEYFDTRMGSWVETEPMNVSRGNFGAFVIQEKLYAIGGVKKNGEILDIVECYEEGSCWKVATLKAFGKRSHFSAIVL